MKNTYKVNEEAVKKIAEKVYDNGSTVINRNDLEEMFPELKESGDEKIRKALIEFFDKDAFDCGYKSEWVNGIKYKDVIAWLEKQGEHAKFIDKIQIGDKVTRNEDGVLVNLSQLKRVAKKDSRYCMYSKDNYTDEDRKVLCGDCEEECEFNKKEEPVSKDLEKAAKRYATEGDEKSGLYIIDEEVEAFKAGAKWQKEHLWKPADGDDLPIIDREVIALLDNGKVVFAHRPPEFWDGKNIITGKVTRNYPKTYDKGGWNIPNIKYWLDVELPKEIEL